MQHFGTNEFCIFIYEYNKPFMIFGKLKEESKRILNSKQII